MMPTPKALLTSDSKKSRRYVAICRAQYDQAGLDDERGQVLNENPAFASGLRDLIARCSMRIVPPSFDPATGTFTWVVDYDRSIAQKIKDRSSISLAWATEYAPDEKFPDERTGRRIVTGRIWYPNRFMKQDAIEREAPGTLARPKELVDFSRAFPRPLLDGDMPLVAHGQFWSYADGSRDSLYLYNCDGGRDLNNIWLRLHEQWSARWRFLVLDK